MTTIILNTVGLILIIYSIYVIRKDMKSQKTVVDDLNLIEKRVKEYYNLTEEIVEGFDEIIDSKLEMINKENKKNNKEELSNLDDKFNNSIDNNSPTFHNENLNLFHKKIIELEKIGLTKEEIAKKLNKGVREIEIILKMYKNKEGFH